MKSKSHWKELIAVCSVMIVAILLRMHHVDQLAVFLSDQAIDSFAVKDILSGHLTLLGPRASVGQFFNGPIVYYLMAPFYFVFSSDPIAGTFFQIVLQIMTIPFLYMLSKRFGDMATGLVSLFLFALSPLLIEYSRATFNSYPAIFFTTVVLYIISAKSPRTTMVLLAGVLTGMLVQMHYFLYLYAFGYFVFICWQHKSVRNSLIFLMGGLVGFSPFLIFEARHGMFNTRAILFSDFARGGSVGFLKRLGDIGTAIGSMFGINIATVGVIIVILVCLLFILQKSETRFKRLFISSLLPLLFCLAIYRGTLQSHYLIGFMMIFIVVTAFVIARILSSRSIILVGIVWISILLYFQTKLFMIPAAQDEFGLIDQRIAAMIISEQRASPESSELTWNITQDVQRDNRAMPLRYLLSLDNSLTQPLSVEEYQSNQELFVIAPTKKPIDKINTWEVRAFGTHYKIISNIPVNKTLSVIHLRKD
ncbi:glycosyltransferase family 39 protein [Candidatus Woesebacteria bacterium]|nr:glycosyltransferase family 39 protein [Candidatus Woesebacteria bacterium]